MKRLFVLTLIAVVIGASLAGAYWWANRPPPPSLNQWDAVFKDDARTNAEFAADDLNLVFLDREGKPRRLTDYRGKKNVVLVFMRGMTKQYNGICPICSAQMSRLLANYGEFEKRQTEVLVVFPGPKKDVAQFVEQTQARADQKSIPFPILYDENFRAVDRLAIRADAAKPSTFVLDKAGQIRFAYVGATATDRPSLATILKQLDALESEKK